MHSTNKQFTALKNKVWRAEYVSLNTIAKSGEALMWSSLAVIFVNISAISFKRLCLITLLHCLSVTRTDRFRAGRSLSLCILRLDPLFPVDKKDHRLGAESQAPLYLKLLIQLSVDIFHNFDNHHLCLSIATATLMLFSWALLSTFDQTCLVWIF